MTDAQGAAPPLVTVNILSYNRIDELRNTLRQIRALTYSPLEVIVVDNASTDGSLAMVHSEFPAVTAIGLGKNIGIEGWNEGFKVSRGEYVFVLDDDSYPSPDAIRKAVEHIRRDPLCGVVACRIIQEGSTAEPRWKTDSLGVSDFVGCGALLRTSVIRAVGGFSPLVFLYAHELDYAMNVYDAGYRIDYLHAATVVHRRSLVHRLLADDRSRDLRHHYYFIRNLTIIALVYFPVRIIGGKVVRFLMGQLFFCAVHGGIGAALKAAISALTTVVKNRHRRKLLQPRTRDFYLASGFMPGFFGDGIFSFKKPTVPAPNRRR